MSEHRNPYPGLRPFRTDEEHLFFGRERQIDRMIDKLAAHRFLAVVGGSGSGKSSLVNCGLRPALHRGNMACAGANWRMAQFRPGSDPIGSLARSLAAPGVLFDTPLSGALSTDALIEATLRLGSLGLVDMVDQADLPAGTQLLVVADQFEELFRFRALVQGAHREGWSPAEDAVAFVRLLLEAAAQTEVPIYVVLTMRSDFLGDCAQFLGLPEAINEGQYLVPRLSRDEIRSAITGPSGVAGATLSPVLVTQLLNDVGDNPDQLSILQHALNRTWAAWESAPAPDKELNLTHYQTAGGMSHALDMHADKAFGELPDAAARRLCEQVFKALTDMGTDPRGVRRPTQLSTLCEITGARTEQLVAVFTAFRKPSRSFLMPPLTEDLGEQSVIDISHESLMRVWLRLKNWADEEAQSARMYRRLRETAQECAKGRASLWRDAELRLALDWRARNTPTAAWAELYGGDFATTMAFLDRSSKAQDQEKLQADIELRWMTIWRWVPVGIMALAFIALQLEIATELKPWLEDLWPLLRHQPKTLAALATLVAGMPAAMGLMLLSPYVRRRFYVWEKFLGIGPWSEAQAPSLAALSHEAEAQAEQPNRHAVNVQSLGYASFLARAGAQMIDWFICWFFCFVILLAWGIASPDKQPSQATQAASQANETKVPRAASASTAASAPEGQDMSDEETSVILLLMVLAFYLYHVQAWTSRHQATWGMRVAKIIVTDTHGRRLGWLRASGRFFARWLSYYTVCLGFLMMGLTEKRQTLHDRLSGTVVLRDTPTP